MFGMVTNTAGQKTLWYSPRLLQAGILAILWTHSITAIGAADLSLDGISVTPHMISDAMRYSRPPDPELGARVQLFVRNSSSSALKLNAESAIRIEGLSAQELTARDEWTWHDFPSAWPDSPLELPSGALTVWTFNGKRAEWGIDRAATMTLPNDAGAAAQAISFVIEDPSIWLSAVTFLSNESNVYPNSLVLHLANERETPVSVVGLRLWLPKNNATWRVLYPQAKLDKFESWPTDRSVPPHDKAVIRVPTGRLPLTYVAVEVELKDERGQLFTVWTHLRIKRETFDISGGWVQGGKHASRVMTFEPFLKTLRRLHVNTAHLADQIPGYTDQTSPGGLYTLYPLKYFNALTPTEKYEGEEFLPRVHAVEFLGEPQYGGGRPVPPMEVWQKLAPYQSTKLPTTLTHSEERIWRYYAGLSDFPHYDAYRVAAPSPDAWSKYDRWDGKKIGWGAPLETIGDMCRSLRELNRPRPTAYWSQGPHHGWGPTWGRKRASPTPDELRLQAYHALSSRITSLYWFNLSLPSLVKYRDTLDELTRVGREIRMLDDFYLAGDAYRYSRVLRDGRPDWDLSSIAAPQGTLLFAMDLDYQPSKTSKVFEFGPPRQTSFQFALPVWCRTPAEVFRVDADGTYDVECQLNDQGIEVADTLHKVGIYVVATAAGTRAEIDQKRRALMRMEQQLGFDPSANDEDFGKLREFLNTLPKD